MSAHIYWERLNVPAREGLMPDRYIVWYQDAQGKKVANEQGPAFEPTLGALYQNLQRRGYNLATLPKPERWLYSGLQ
jgi:hypothetical protein